MTRIVGTFFIRNTCSGLYLDIKSAILTTYAVLTHFMYGISFFFLMCGMSGNDHQKWILYEDGFIENLQSQWVLDVSREKGPGSLTMCFFIFLDVICYPRKTSNIQNQQWSWDGL